MSPTRCYDAARLGEAAEEAAKRYQKLSGCDLVCKYDGVVGGGSPTKRAMVQFCWRVADGAEEKVQLRCGDACARGIPVPGKLKEAYCRRRLEELVQVSEAEARDLCGVGPNLTCRWLYCKNDPQP